MRTSLFRDGRHARRRPPITQTRRLLSSGLALFGMALLLWGAVAGAALPSSAQAAVAHAVNQCNGTDNVGGQAVECTVTVTNNRNVATGKTSSTVRVRECHGAANAPPTCTVTTTPFTALTTSVTQCDGSGSGGGGTVTCTVAIVNNITGPATTSPATINQCNGSGTGGGTQPDPRLHTSGQHDWRHHHSVQYGR